MSRILDDKLTIELNEQKYQARFDLLAIAETQYYFRSRGCPMTVPQIFKAIGEEDYFVIYTKLQRQIFLTEKTQNLLKGGNQ